MILSDDEIILQIKNGNMEALRLLFSCYKIHFKTLETKMRLRYRFIGYDRYDLINIMMSNMINIIKLYDMNRSSFFSFWQLLETRNLLSLYKQNYQEIKIQSNQVDINDEYVDFFINKTHSVDYEKDYILCEEYNSQLNLVKDSLGDDFKKVLLMWSRGYKYNEISQKLNIKTIRVNYIIRTSLKLLKEKNDNKKD